MTSTSPASTRPGGRIHDRRDRAAASDVVVTVSVDTGNASAHTCDNLLILVACDGLNHAGHMALDRKNYQPLSNLFVRLPQQVGIESDRFGTSTGALGVV